MNEDDIIVTKTENFATFRQHIRPKSQESVLSIVSALLDVYRAAHITGPVTLHFNQGGVRSMEYDQIAVIPSGSEADKAVESLYAKNLNGYARTLQ